MPPEALISNKYSHKSDIWAIGVIFFEMLTGNTPWTGRTETELKTKIKTVPIKNILPANISKASTVFLIKALDTDHRKRMDVF
jgi:serine/threonine-protein kinase ULK/ATG1